MTTAAERAVPMQPAQAIEAESIGLRYITDIARAEKIWRSFEDKAVMTAYQRFDFLAAWYRHIGRREEIAPMIIIGEINGEPAFLWPFGISAQGPWRVARWLGGRHANYNLGLYDKAAMGSLDAEAMSALFARVAGLAGGIDVFELMNQPETWEGVDNPVAGLPHQPSPSFAYAMRLGADFETVLAEKRSAKARKKIRHKERRLAELEGYKCAMAETPAEARRVLEVFAEQKAARFAQMGIDNPFHEPGVMDFFHDLAARSMGVENPAFRLAYIEAEGEIQATFSGTTTRGRCSGSINSFANNEIAKFSPGESALMKLMADACERGCDSFDLGVGEAYYKDLWCDTTEPLFDCFVPITPAGHVYAQIKGLRQRVKRSIKQNPVAWGLVQRVRRARGAAAQQPAEAPAQDD
ncbi:MAG: GNAT family N-acetyltransferase [Hyphomicrobiales bacterium]